MNKDISEDDPLEVRVVKLETDMHWIKSKMNAIDTKIISLEDKISKLDDKMWALLLGIFTAVIIGIMNLVR